MNLGTFEIDTNDEYKELFDVMDVEKQDIAMQNIGGNSFIVKEGETGEGFIVNDSSITLWKDTGEIPYIKTFGTIKLNISK